MHDSKQRGFTLTSVLLGVVLVVAIIGVGYWTYVNQRDHNSTTGPAATSEQENNRPEVTDRKPIAGELFVEEWGLRVKVDSAVTPQYGDGGGLPGSPRAEAIILSTSELIAEDQQGCAIKHGALGSIYRIPTDEKYGGLGEFDGTVAEAAATGLYDVYTIIGDYAYVWGTSHVTCGEKDTFGHAQASLMTGLRESAEVTDQSQAQ